MNEACIKIHKLCIKKNLSFATFRFPGQANFTTYIQTSHQTLQWDKLSSITERKGFIMAPFDTRNGAKYIMIRPDIIINGDDFNGAHLDKISTLPDNPPTEWKPKNPVVTEREEYITQIKAIEKQISTGFFQKSVLSRISLVQGNYLPVITEIFNEVCKKHPNSFVYLFKSNDQFWLGASPEPLLRVSDGIVSTVSLAATRDFSEQNMDPGNWTLKEVLEQEYVTHYIHDNLRTFHIRDYRVTSPYVKKAGDIVHLRTDFQFKSDHIAGRIWKFLNALHPTPAVAGQPKDEAISYIKQLEPHDREYYTGFLGPVQSDEIIDLFVNLRCLKITPDYLSLYIGGGITLESVPEDEWEETQLKSKSLLNIIDQFSKYTDDKTTI